MNKEFEIFLKNNKYFFVRKNFSQDDYNFLKKYNYYFNRDTIVADIETNQILSVKRFKGEGLVKHHIGPHFSAYYFRNKELKFFKTHESQEKNKKVILV